MLQMFGVGKIFFRCFKKRILLCSTSLNW